MSYKIAVIVSTTRPSRVGRKIADWFMQEVSGTENVEFELIDLADENLPFLNEPESPSTGNYVHEHTKKWAEKVSKYDGYVIVTAEYNHGYPAPIKNALDSAYAEWQKKPVAFVGYGGMGGARAIEQLVQVTAQIGMVPLPSTTVNIIDVWFAVNEQGEVNKEFVRGDKDKLVANLLDWAGILTKGKQ